jgi:radical SAM protein with 4Fe4S-binding SPASM domain
MFDIDFVLNSQQLIKELVNGEWKDRPDSELLAAFDKLHSTNPVLFNIEDTNACNMKCIMCPRTELMTRAIKTLSLKDFELVLKQISPPSKDELEQLKNHAIHEFGIKENEQSEDHFYYFIISRSINLHGYGETIIDPEIHHKVKLCKDYGFETYFSCVPNNVTLKKAEQLMQAGLTYLKFAMESLSDEVQQQIRGPRAKFSEAYHIIQQVMELKRKLNSDTTFIATMLEMDGPTENKKMQQEFLNKFRELGLYSYIKTRDNQWLEESGNNTFKPSPKAFCEYPFTSLSIMSDGNVVPCTQDYNSEMIMGNIHQETLEEIWNEKKYRQFREYHITGKFPENFKCNERCDNMMVCERKRGEKPRMRVM